MTDFYIGYPHIPFLSSDTDASGTLATGCVAENLATGDRGNITRLASKTASTYQVRWTTTATTDYLFIARADLLIADNVNSVAVDRSPDDSTWTRVFTDASFAGSAAGNKGPEGEDYLATWATSSSYAYWRTDMGNSATSDYPCSKIYLGNLFNLGRNPVYSASVNRSKKYLATRRAPFTVTLTWRGITDALRKSFSETIGQYAEINPVVLYDKNATLLPFYTLFAWVKNYEFTPIANNVNQLTCVFEECI